MKTVRSNWLSRLGIVVIAALLVAAISVVQYQRLRSIMDKERDIRSHMVLRALSNRIVGVLDLAEATMAENLLYLKRSLDNPDSVFKANPADRRCGARLYHEPVFHPGPRDREGRLVGSLCLWCGFHLEPDHLFLSRYG